MIKFDLDGVLIKFGEYAEQLFRNRGYTVVKGEEFHWQTQPALSNNQIWKVFKEAYLDYKKQEAHEGAKELLRYVWQMTGSPVHIITARPSQYTTETQLLIERHFDVPFLLGMTQHDIDGTGGGSTKHLYLEPGDIFVEDRRRTVLELEKVGIRTILVDRHYNQIEDEEDHPLITRVDSLDEIIPMLPFLGAK
jgi:FMN phosphatase YigB (HAD superfamily)